MLSGEQDRAFRAFYQSARRNGILDERTTLMLHLGAAMALGCEPCMKHYLAQVRQAGLGEREINAVQAIVMAVAAGKVGAQLREVQAEEGHTAPTSDGPTQVGGPVTAKVASEAGEGSCPC